MTGTGTGRGRTSLTRRDTAVQEFMDDPDCDPDRLEHTYRQFRTVNRLVSGWRRLYRDRIRPCLDAHRPTTLLDIGFGAGDISRALIGWAAHDRLILHTTAIDPDPRAVRHVRGRPTAGVRFEQASSADLAARGDRYDLVISNHLLHHLDASALADLLADSRALSRRLVIHNDLFRGRLAYGVYAVATLPFARGSFIHQDGSPLLLGVMLDRAEYRPGELSSFHSVFSMGAAMENLWLTTVEFGMGIQFISFPMEVPGRWDEIVRLVDVPDDLELMAVYRLGYLPAEQRRPPIDWTSEQRKLPSQYVFRGTCATPQQGWDQPAT